LIQLLRPSELQDDVNDSRLKLIIDIQAELDQSLREIFSIAAGIQRKPVSIPTRSDDQDLEEYKEFRRQGLANGLELLNQSLVSIFDQSSLIIKELTKPSTMTIQWHQYLEWSRRSAIVREKISIASSINQVIQWISAHEFTLIQERWVPRLYLAHNAFLFDLPKLIYRAIYHLEPNDPPVGLAKCLKSEHALPLAQALIPLIKLSRVFFKKVMNNGLHQIPSKPYTNMNSHQLETLGHSVGFILHYFHNLMKAIADYGSEHRDRLANQYPPSIEPTINKIVARFNSDMLLVVTYVIPLIPDSVSEPNHLQTFLVEWNRLFLITAQLCRLAAQSYNAASQAAEPHE
jgi:hypothetical protein